MKSVREMFCREASFAVECFREQERNNLLFVFGILLLSDCLFSHNLLRGLLLEGTNM